MCERSIAACICERIMKGRVHLLNDVIVTAHDALHDSFIIELRIVRWNQPFELCVLVVKDGDVAFLQAARVIGG
jgi:hypothetical protein